MSAQDATCVLRELKINLLFPTSSQPLIPSEFACGINFIWSLFNQKKTFKFRTECRKLFILLTGQLFCPLITLSVFVSTIITARFCNLVHFCWEENLQPVAELITYSSFKWNKEREGDHSVKKIRHKCQLKQVLKEAKFAARKKLAHE